jgi:hypothetical protein
MKKAKVYTILILFVLLPLKASAQLDTLFWFVAPELTSGHGDNPVVFRFATMDEPATISITQPANPAFPEQILNLATSTSQTLNLAPWFAMVENFPANTVLNRGFKITSTSSITAYYESNPTCACNPDIMALKGKNALGTNFIVGGQTFYNNGNYNPPANGKFDIVATEDNTTITIIPSNNISDHLAGVPFSIVLNAGQTWSGVAVSLLGNMKVVGTIISADKPIALTYTDDSLVFGGCLDVLSDQLIPTSIIGSEYIAVRGFLQGQDRVFVTAASPNTQVFTNGNPVPVATLQVGQTHMIDLISQSVYITTSEPAYVFHVTGFGCEVGGAILPPIVCTGSNEVPFIRSTNEFFGVIILVPSGAEDDFLFDGQAGIIQAAAFSFVPGTNDEWMYAQIDMSSQVAVNQGIRVQNSEERFHLGIINGGSSSGCRFGFFSDFASFKYQIEPSTNTVCEGGTLVFTTNEVPGATYDWTGPNGFTSQGSSITIADASLVNTGWYNVSGNFPNACELVPDSVFVTVNPNPSIDAAYIELCDGQSVAIDVDVDWFSSNSDNVNVSFGDGQNAQLVGSSVNHTYANAGQYTVTITAESDLGCTDSFDLPIIVNAIPQVSFESQSFCSSSVDFAYNITSISNTLDITSHYWIIQGDSIFTSSPTIFASNGTGTYDANFGLVATNGCVYTYSFSYFVDSDIDISNFQLPNVITANADGTNDLFLVDPYFDLCVDYTIEFINRWGQPVYTMTSNANAFGGIDSNGDVLPIGVYFYKFTSELIELHGFVHVIR